MTIEIKQGHVIDKLRELPDKSVHCVVTSPPYWGLRNYGTAGIIWESYIPCTCKEHEWKMVHPSGYRESDTNPGEIQSEGTKNRDGLTSYICKNCGSWRGELGLEPTPEMYVDHLVEIFRKMWRVLRDDGTVWLVIGDSYTSGNTPEGLKPKDLVGIPWRTAFALQADGWYLRSDIIWSKPNPMPESGEDRPVKGHEYVFLLSKSRKYYYDYVAIQEKSAYDGRQDTVMKGSEKYRNGYAPTDNPQSCAIVGHERWPFKASDGTPMRNRRTVWEIPTQPTPDAHFATYPEALVLPCIRAGTSDMGVCPDCGAPWVRIIHREKADRVERTDNPNTGGLMRCPPQQDKVTTKGWEPSCKCGKIYSVSATILDPFGGSGTTAKVARELNRHCILIELNPDYIKIMRKKLRLNEQLIV